MSAVLYPPLPEVQGEFESGDGNGLIPGQKGENEIDEEAGKGSSKKLGKKDRDESGNNGQNSDHQPSQSSGETDEDESPDRPKATKYTKEQREAVTRIRKLLEDDYYGILGLEETCSEREIKKAYKTLSILTHPDKNKFKDASEAFRG
jgi:DnaJ domain